jgi:putative nucleotidyltransferase with HDIG domain
MKNLAHLARRFFGSIRARRPGPADQSLVADLLTPAESEVFWSQPVPDLAHAIRMASAVQSLHPERSDLIRAALLHDVGKRKARIGTMLRSLATASAIVRIPTAGGMARYLRHGEIGARELEELGCEALVVQFARHHHGPKPDRIDEDDWNVLLGADNE